MVLFDWTIIQLTSSLAVKFCLVKRFAHPPCSLFADVRNVTTQPLWTDYCTFPLDA